MDSSRGRHQLTQEGRHPEESSAGDLDGQLHWAGEDIQIANKHGKAVKEAARPSDCPETRTARI